MEAYYKNNYQNPFVYSAGILYIHSNKDISIAPKELYLYDTGFQFQFDKDLELLVFGNDKLFKSGVIVINEPGTVDADYRGNVMIAFYNTSKKTYNIEWLDLIAILRFGLVVRDWRKADKDMDKLEDKVLYYKAEKNFEPYLGSELASGLDLRAYIKKKLVVPSGQSATIPTGVKVRVPKNVEVHVRARSGFSTKNRVLVFNEIITHSNKFVDVEVKLLNLGSDDLVIEPGTRIAQMVAVKSVNIELYETNDLSQTERGDAGFGSTGT
jgi:dUTP pyrophosphatase